MTVISPYSSTFSNTYNEVKDLYSQGELQSKEERNDFIKSKWHIFKEKWFKT